MGDYDAFLCCNDDKEDKREALRIYDELEKRGIVIWFEERDLRPGGFRLSEIGEQIKKVKAGIVCFGNRNDNLRWLETQMEALLNQFINRGCTIIIPVLLQHAPHEKPTLRLSFSVKWVDFHERDPDPIEQLIWGIKGDKP